MKNQSSLAGALLVNLAFLMQRPTGTNIYGLNLLPYLQRLDPTLLSAQPIDAYRCYPIPSGLTAEQGGKGHLKRLFWTQWRLPAIYHQQKARLLFSPIPEAPLFSACQAVVTVHDLIPLRFPKRRSPLTAYCRHYVPRVLAQARHILTDSQATADDLIHFFGIPSAKMTVVPLAYDAAHFRPLNLPQQKYFLYVGRHDSYKNLHRLIEAFAALPPADDLQLWISGPPDPRYTPSLKALVQSLALAHRVRFLGYVSYDQLPVLLNQAIALVFPSLWEGFGLPVLEAMACGTPVMTSNLSSLPEVAGDAALLVDPYKVDEMANALQVLAHDANVRSQLRQMGLARARQFSWAQTGQATVEVLSQYL